MLPLEGTCLTAGCTSSLRCRTVCQMQQARAPRSQKRQGARIILALQKNGVPQGSRGAFLAVGAYLQEVHLFKIKIKNIFFGAIEEVATAVGKAECSEASNIGHKNGVRADCGDTKAMLKKQALERRVDDRRIETPQMGRRIPLVPSPLAEMLRRDIDALFRRSVECHGRTHQRIAAQAGVPHGVNWAGGVVLLEHGSRPSVAAE